MDTRQEEGWIEYVEYRGSKDFKVYDPFEWEVAKETCEYDGGQLASVLNAREQEEVTALKKPTVKCIWLGGTFQERWRWIDGSTWHFTNWGKTRGEDVALKKCLNVVGYTSEWKEGRCKRDCTTWQKVVPI